MDNYFWRSFHTYRKGLLKKAEPQDQLDHPFTVLLAFQTMDLVPLRQRLLKRRVNRTTAAGLKLSREGRLDLALKNFQAGQAVIEQMADGPGRHLVEAFHEAAWAYLEYRESRPGHARQRVSHALELDRLLEREHGFAILQLHRIQLGHNHSRVEMRFGSKNKALKLCGEIMSYLVSGPPPNFDRDWDPKGLLSIPPSRRSGMLDQVGSESISQLVVSQSAEFWQKFYQHLGTPWLDVGRNGLSSSLALRWFEAKNAQLNHDLERYFELFDGVVADGVGNHPGLFFSVMLDFARLCQSRGPHQVLDWILRDSQKWIGVPPFIKAEFDALAEMAQSA